MPCYDPPPPWEGKQRANAEEATKILCEFVRERLYSRPEEIPTKIRKWFLEHRKIDVEIYSSTYYGGKNAKKEQEAARKDVERMKYLLS